MNKIINFIREFSYQLIIGLAVAVVPAYLGVNDFIESRKSGPVNPQGIWNTTLYESGKEVIGVLQIINQSGKLSGKMVENRGTLQKPIQIQSSIEGNMDGNIITIDKKHTDKSQYPDTKYSGKVDPSGSIMEGKWSNSNHSGTFKFFKSN